MSTRLDGGREVRLLRGITRSRTCPQQIEILQCDSTLEPGVLGIVRPKLLWPAGLSDRLSDPELESILAHEACHVDRRDNLSALVQVVVEHAFWFHPLVWWLGTRLVDARELACDEEVLQMGTDNHSYAEGILKVCGFYLRSPLTLVAGVGGSDLAARIERIVKGSRPRPVSVPARLLLDERPGPDDWRAARSGCGEFAARTRYVQTRPTRLRSNRRKTSRPSIGPARA